MKHLREFVTLLQMADIDLKQGEPMCRHTTFQIGGPVAVMAFPNSPEQVGEILKIARRYEITPMILGAGSNILAPDEGLDTVVIELRKAMNRVEERSKGKFEAQAGAAMARLATFAMERGYTGLEFAHGIPGTVGGGGLGDLAVKYGYNRFQVDIMVYSVIILCLLVLLIQGVCNFLYKILR